MAATHLFIVGIVLLLMIVLVAVIQRGATGGKWWSIIGSLVLFFVITPLVAGVNWSALFN